MKLQKVWDLVKRTEFAQLGFLDAEGTQNIRTVWCTWHKGLKSHYISSNTSSVHIQSLLKNGKACLYFYDSNAFEGLCLWGEALVCQDEERRKLLWTEDALVYYPKGVNDEDYSVIEFVAEGGRYYGSLGSFDITAQDIQESDFGDIPVNYF